VALRSNIRACAGLLPVRKSAATMVVSGFGENQCPRVAQHGQSTAHPGCLKPRCCDDPVMTRVLRLLRHRRQQHRKMRFSLGAHQATTAYLRLCL
jgi:hypothetical protein